MKKYKQSFGKPSNSPRPRGSEPVRLQLFSACWWPAESGSTRPLVWTWPDVDLDRGILHIRRTKFRKSRYVPVHPTTVVTLRKYAEARDLLFSATSTPAFFLSERGRRIPAKTAQYNFAKVSQRVGLRLPAKHHGSGPRLHDLRHRFATRTLIQWYRAGLDVERKLPKLSTYLGLVHVNDTYWYLEAV